MAMITPNQYLARPLLDIDKFMNVWQKHEFCTIVNETNLTTSTLKAIIESLGEKTRPLTVNVRLTSLEDTYINLGEKVRVIEELGGQHRERLNRHRDGLDVHRREIDSVVIDVSQHTERLNRHRQGIDSVIADVRALRAFVGERDEDQNLPTVNNRLVQQNERLNHHRQDIDSLDLRFTEAINAVRPLRIKVTQLEEASHEYFKSIDQQLFDHVTEIVKKAVHPWETNVVQLKKIADQAIEVDDLIIEEIKGLKNENVDLNTKISLIAEKSKKRKKQVKELAALVDLQRKEILLLKDQIQRQDNLNEKQHDADEKHLQMYAQLLERVEKMENNKTLV